MSRVESERNRVIQEFLRIIDETNPLPERIKGAIPYFLQTHYYDDGYTVSYEADPEADAYHNETGRKKEVYTPINPGSIQMSMDDLVNILNTFHSEYRYRLDRIIQYCADKTLQDIKTHSGHVKPDIVINMLITNELQKRSKDSEESRQNYWVENTIGKVREMVASVRFDEVDKIKEEVIQNNRLWLSEENKQKILTELNKHDDPTYRINKRIDLGEMNFIYHLKKIQEKLGAFVKLNITGKEKSVQLRVEIAQSLLSSIQVFLKNLENPERAWSLDKAMMEILEEFKLAKERNDNASVKGNGFFSGNVATNQKEFLASLLPKAIRYLEFFHDFAFPKSPELKGSNQPG